MTLSISRSVFRTIPVWIFWDFSKLSIRHQTNKTGGIRYDPTCSIIWKEVVSRKTNSKDLLISAAADDQHIVEDGGRGFEVRFGRCD